MPVTAEEALSSIEEIAQLTERALPPGSSSEAMGPAVGSLMARKRSGFNRFAAINLALCSDAMRAVSIAIDADDQRTTEELDYVFPIAYRCARFLSKTRPGYEPFVSLDHASMSEFLDIYRADAEVFGGACSQVPWPGLDLCYRAAQRGFDSTAAKTFERTLTEVIDTVIGLGGVEPQEADVRSKLLEELACVGQDAEVPSDPGADPRLTAFLDPEGPEVFDSIAQAYQVWEPDPYDEPSVHAQARDSFARLVDSATSHRSAGQGRILLVLGDSGAGKTHLMRAFRNTLHQEGLGFVGYLQLSTRSRDYGRYALYNYLDSLDKPYAQPAEPTSGLALLSTALAERAVSPKALAALREQDFPNHDALAELVSELADGVCFETPGFSGFDIDLVRAFLYLQREDPRIKARVIKYLRCEQLSPYDARMLGGIGSRSDGDAPVRTLEQLGQLVFAVTGRAMVLLVDQIEDVFSSGEAQERFPLMMDVIRRLTDCVRSSVVVVSCLDDMYEQVKAHLSRPMIDRLERNPSPARLSERRSEDEIEAIVSRRLQALYQRQGVEYRDDEPVYPFSPGALERLKGLRTRDVLQWCHDFQRSSLVDGKIPSADQAVATRPPTAAPAAATGLAQIWNDFRTEYSEDSPDDDARYLELVEAAVQACAEEMPHLELATVREGERLRITFGAPHGGTAAVVAAITNKNAQGGGLLRVLKRFVKEAGDDPITVLRCSEFPGGRSQTARFLGQLRSRGGERLVVEDSEWRTVMAYREFQAGHHTDPEFTQWLRRDRPVTQLPFVRDLLHLQDRKPASKQQPANSTPPTTANDSDAPRKRASQQITEKVKTPTMLGRVEASARPTAPAGPVVLGETGGLRPQSLSLDPSRFTRHAAFLGGTGSGKTTLALNILEQLLLRGVPVVLVDRKGDLCRYGSEAWWAEPQRSPVLAERKARLREAIDVTICTPGEPEGNALTIPVVPHGLEALGKVDRARAAQTASDALASMLRYQARRQSDAAKITILAKAIELIGTSNLPGSDLDLLIQLLHDEDPSLLNAIGMLDPKHCAPIVQNLEVLRLSRGELLEDRGGTPLSPQTLFRRGAKTPLTIISTKFLRDNAGIEFWVARMLLEVSRWASQNPSDTLQGVMMFDEADVYMPAQSKPATKEPMQDLLKRARSAGLGVFLATQSPGDLDYRSRDNIGTWFVGRIAERRAIEKMRPLLSDARVDITAKLARQKIGEFFVLNGGKVTELKSQRSALDTQQQSETEILELARARRSS